MSGRITAVLNGFRRPEYLREQYEAVANQSVPPETILFWQNGGGEFDAEIVGRCRAAISNFNFGVWARFAFALNARTEYVCVFDDDTIPGRRWFENCLSTIKTHQGLLGTRGLIFCGRQYADYEWCGWGNPNREVIQVDIVGHCWFFEREFLSYYWRELPPLDLSLAGEDMHFSYALQKYANLPTFVPPHPAGQEELWGSIRGMLGEDGKGLSCLGGAGDRLEGYFATLIGRGWKLLHA